MSEQPSAVRTWRAIAESKDLSQLDDLLADDVVFRSPAVFSPQEGKALTTNYLSSAIVILGPTLRYTGEWYGAASAVLEFEAEIDGMYVQGVDMMSWNSDDKLVSFTVMVRPIRGLQKLIELMGRQLAAAETV